MTTTQNLTGSYTAKDGSLIAIARNRYGYLITHRGTALATGQSRKSTLAFLRGAGV